jgi:hypothetical protein
LRASAERGQSVDRALVEDERLLPLALLRVQLGAEEEAAVVRGIRTQDLVQERQRLRHPAHGGQGAGAVERSARVHGQRGTRTRGKNRCT